MAKVREHTARWQRTRVQVMREAERVFGAHGFAGASLDAIAEELDMRRPSLKHYFRDKEELYVETLTGIVEELTERIEFTREIADPLHRMDAVASTWIDFLSERPHAARILLRHQLDIDVFPKGIPANIGALGRMLAAVEDAIREGVDKGVFKPVDPSRYMQIVSGATMVWVATRDATRIAMPFDALSPEAVGDLRETLILFTRSFLSVSK